MPQITAEHIYQKAVSTLAEHLGPIDLLFLQECMQDDPHEGNDGFFEELTRVVTEMHINYLGNTTSVGDNLLWSIIKEVKDDL